MRSIRPSRNHLNQKQYQTTELSPDIFDALIQQDVSEFKTETKVKKKQKKEEQ